MTVPVNDEKSGLNWTAGCRRLRDHGRLHEVFPDPEGDFGRTKRQRMVISAIIKKAVSPQCCEPVHTAEVLKPASSLTVDQKTSTPTMVRMAPAFQSARRRHRYRLHSSQNYRSSRSQSGLRNSPTIRRFPNWQTVPSLPTARVCRILKAVHTYTAGIQGVLSLTT